jgi:hypothetical protein
MNFWGIRQQKLGAGTQRSFLERINVRKVRWSKMGISDKLHLFHNLSKFKRIFAHIQESRLNALTTNTYCNIPIYYNFGILLCAVTWGPLSGTLAVFAW